MTTSIAGSVLEDLERAGADARDQQRLVAGVDVAVAALGGELLGVLARLVEVAAVEDDLGAEARIAATLTGLAPSGTQTIARTPKSRAA